MEILNHLFTALGRLLLWVSALVIEELMFGGLARLLLSRTSKSRASRVRKQTATSSKVPSKEVQGETSC